MRDLFADRKAITEDISASLAKIAAQRENSGHELRGLAPSGAVSAAGRDLRKSRLAALLEIF
jgi:hypothetical protein